MDDNVIINIEDLQLCLVYDDVLTEGKLSKPVPVNKRIIDCGYYFTDKDGNRIYQISLYITQENPFTQWESRSALSYTNSDIVYAEYLSGKRGITLEGANPWSLDYGSYGNVNKSTIYGEMSLSSHVFIFPIPTAEDTTVPKNKDGYIAIAYALNREGEMDDVYVFNQYDDPALNVVPPGKRASHPYTYAIRYIKAISESPPIVDTYKVTFDIDGTPSVSIAETAAPTLILNDVIKHTDIKDSIDNTVLLTGCISNVTTHVPLFAIQYMLDSMLHSNKDIMTYFKGKSVPYTNYIKYITYILFSKSPQDFINTIGIAYIVTSKMKEHISNPLKNGMLELVWSTGELIRATQAFISITILTILYKSGKHDDALVYLDNDITKYENNESVSYMDNVNDYTMIGMINRVLNHLNTIAVDLTCADGSRGDDTGDSDELMTYVLKTDKTGSLYVLIYNSIVLQMDGENASIVSYSSDMFQEAVLASDIGYMHTYIEGSVTLTKVKLIEDKKLPERSIGMSMWLKLKLGLPDEITPGIKCYLK